ncbi:hypothetical protein [Streptomyces sp. NPDC056632]|uniref:hypothetical protein n=1 Tax=Streptomyces sp. NPDC056632 TaxID=3345884 RepID=UPI003681F951
MLPESPNGRSGGELAVPMGWMYAEFIADRLMYMGALVFPGSLEWRAGRDALALTVYFSGSPSDLFQMFSMERRERWLHLTAEDGAWYAWVNHELERRAALRRTSPSADPDAGAALVAWEWLRDTLLLPPTAGCATSESVRSAADHWTPAWQVGLSLSHLAVDF